MAIIHSWRNDTIIGVIENFWVRLNVFLRKWIIWRLTVFISGWACGEVLSQFSVCLASLNGASTVPHPLSWTWWQEVLELVALGSGALMHWHPPLFLFQLTAAVTWGFQLIYFHPKLQLAMGYHRPHTAGRKGEGGGGCLPCFPLSGLVWFISVYMQKDSSA